MLVGVMKVVIMLLGGEDKMMSCKKVGLSGSACMYG